MSSVVSHKLAHDAWQTGSYTMMVWCFAQSEQRLPFPTMPLPPKLASQGRRHPPNTQRLREPGRTHGSRAPPAALPLGGHLAEGLEPCGANGTEIGGRTVWIERALRRDGIGGGEASRLGTVGPLVFWSKGTLPLQFEARLAAGRPLRERNLRPARDGGCLLALGHLRSTVDIKM
jgi:hypothetical protein